MSEVVTEKRKSNTRLEGL